MSDKVKCINCGYLAIRNQQTRQLMELEIELRASRVFPVREESVGSTVRTLPVYGMRPICFRMEKQFEDELANMDATKKTEFAACFDEIVDEDRNCESFTPWKQGWTPKEHLEMQWRETQDKLIERHHRQSLAIALIGAMLGLFATIWATANNQAPVVNVINQIPEDSTKAVKPIP